MSHKLNVQIAKVWADDCGPDEQYTASVLRDLVRQYESGIFGPLNAQRIRDAAKIERQAASVALESWRVEELLGAAETLALLASKVHPC